MVVCLVLNIRSERVGPLQLHLQSSFYGSFTRVLVVALFICGDAYFSISRVFAIFFFFLLELTLRGLWVTPSWFYS